MPEKWINRSISNPDVPANVDLIVTLDQHLYPALLPLIKKYGNKNGVNIAVQEGTCGISAGALADKEAHIGGFCCPAGESDRLPGLTYHTLGIAALALIVNRENSVNDISLPEARELFMGIKSEWSEFGSNRKVIQKNGYAIPIARLHCKNRPGHWRLLLDNEDLFSARLHEVSTIPDMLSSVSRMKNAIGYETLWMVKKYAKESPVKLLKLDGIDPENDKELIQGKYPLYRTYNITLWSEGVAHSTTADHLAAYLKENFQQLDAKYGLVPAEKLRNYGWKFNGDELIGEPD